MLQLLYPWSTAPVAAWIEDRVFARDCFGAVEKSISVVPVIEPWLCSQPFHNLFCKLNYPFASLNTNIPCLSAANLNLFWQCCVFQIERPVVAEIIVIVYINTLWTGDAYLRLYITTVQDGCRKSAFLTRAWFPRTIHLITQYMEHFSEWSCWRMFIETRVFGEYFLKLSAHKSS